MRFAETKIHGAFIVDLDALTDSRGYFARVWCAKEFKAKGLDPGTRQANLSFNTKAGTLRGLHFQKAPHCESKLVRCTKGAIYDVLVDLRPDSPTQHQWLGIELDADNHRALWVPQGCGHGFQSLVDNTEVFYFATADYEPDAEGGVHYADPTLNIDWPLAVTEISTKDASWPWLSDQSMI
jgi:dTDP-4-dehydrorhamnose 3,5-epimerase